MLRHILFLLVLVAWVRPSSAAEAGPYRTLGITEAELRAAALFLPEEESHEPRRLVAAALALTLGPFGAHRLYLGTDMKVPVIYGITFGGFGVLAVIDLAHILFTKDLAAYENDPDVFMWSGPRKAATPP